MSLLHFCHDTVESLETSVPVLYSCSSVARMVTSSVRVGSRSERMPLQSRECESVLVVLFMIEGLIIGSAEALPILCVRYFR